MSKAFSFQAFQNKDIAQLTSVREGETKVGQVVSTEISSKTKYVVLGVCEDIGPQANFGRAGAKNGFTAFLRKFVNMQVNRRFFGEDICIYGKIEQHCSFENVEQARKLVEELDDVVCSTVSEIYAKGCIPIVIGGGHNNAYPLIKAFATSTKTKLEVVNLDPHADCRALEGRHSGNPFSYAYENNYMNFYTVLGLHTAYNSETMLQYMNDKGFYYSYFEEYIVNPKRIERELQTILIRSDEKLGIELDLDAIKGMPSSAYTPSGVSVEQARRYIMKLVSSKRQPAYLHLPEGAPNSEEEKLIVGKTLAYLVFDFISAGK